ncbi:hypothetical protein LCGC14_1215760 [marine sediment metagenome]|uniref:Uncharacterized protein n=1 Tax=marine sediment metagenome TaxID=412755 RepID=A0A0F9NV02_9ZZZZ
MAKDKKGRSIKDQWLGLPTREKQKRSESRVQTAVVFWEKEMEILIRICKKHDCSRSDAIRIAINAYKI